jgi:hypothetical protein
MPLKKGMNKATGFFAGQQLKLLINEAISIVQTA